MKLKQIMGAAAVSLAVAGCGEQDFDYDAATQEQREAWLMSYANELNSGFRDGLRSSDALKFFYIQDPQAKPNDRKIVLAARFKSSEAKIGAFKSKIRDAVLAGSCPGYLKGELARKKISVVVDLLYASGQRAVTVEQNVSTCAKYG